MCKTQPQAIQLCRSCNSGGVSGFLCARDSPDCVTGKATALPVSTLTCSATGLSDPVGRYGSSLTGQAALRCGPFFMHKVCPIILRRSARGPEVLAFRHPTAGCQLVKGTREAGERLSDAVRRELREESGLNLQTPRRLVRPIRMQDGALWHLFALPVDPPLPSRWRHETEDDEGHVFAFFWHPIHARPGTEWHPKYKRILTVLRRQVVRSTPRLERGSSSRGHPPGARLGHLRARRS